MTDQRPSGDQLWEDLLERLTRAVGVPCASEEQRVLARRLAPLAHSDWMGALQDLCEDLGLHARPTEGGVADAVADVGPAHPVVVCEPDGTWVLLTGRRTRQVEIQRHDSYAPEWVSVRELATRLDPASSGAVRWLAVASQGLFRYTDAGDIKSGTVRSPWARLRGLMAQERQSILVALVYACGVGLLSLTMPVAVQALVNTVAFGTLLQPLAVLSLLLMIALSFAGVLRGLQAWVVELLQRRVFVRLVYDLAYRLPRVERSAFDRAHGPELINRFFDLFTIQKATASLLIGGLELVLTALFGMLVLAFYHPFLLAFDVLLLLVVTGILFGLGRGGTATSLDESKAKYEVASWLEEVARHPSAFKLSGGPAFARDRTERLAAKYIKKRDRHFAVVFRQLVGALALQACASVGILAIGGWLVIERQLTLGQLVAAELIVTLVVASAAKVGKHLETTYDLLAALDKVGQLTDLPVERSQPQAVSMSPPAPSGIELTANDLSFGFPGRKTLFSGVSLHLRAGSRAVLSGESGSGRSALIDVLLGLRTPSSGRTEVDGVDVVDLDRRDLRERTALVRGEETIVGTLLENVVFGRPALDGPRVREALTGVGLLGELAALPDGLETRIMPDGSPLSRGQARRLVLARAIVGLPSFLVVDGVLDGLDPQTRATVLNTLFAEDAPWTLFFVSDDPEVRARCDRHLVLANGELRESVAGGPGRGGRS